MKDKNSLTVKFHEFTPQMKNHAHLGGGKLKIQYFETFFCFTIWLSCSIDLVRSALDAECKTLTAPKKIK